jgi:predicted permease
MTSFKVQNVEKLCFTSYYLIGIIFAATSNIPLTIEGTSLDFLRMLPLKKGRFAVSKAVTVLVFPLLFSFLYVVFYGYYEREVFYFLPYAFFIPVISSFLSMCYYFRYKSDEVGVPKISWARMTLLMLSVILLLILVYLPVVLLAGSFEYIGYFCSCGVVVVLWKFLISFTVSPR